MTDSLISNVFNTAKAAKRMAFMPFVTAGDPDLDFTAELIRTLAKEDVDLIEVGFPYSDPIADGPVIQASYSRALDQKIRVADIFAMAGSISASERPVLVGMVAYSIIFRFGTEQFLTSAAEAGFAGLIVPDLPGDEAGDFAQEVRAAGLDLIQLVAPTTPADRVANILKSASGFLYCISVAGTTGERTELPSALKDQLDGLRKQTELPLAVGFGISGPDQVAILKSHADGVIVGSAIVRKLEALANGAGDRAAVLNDVRQFAQQMMIAVAVAES